MALRLAPLVVSEPVLAEPPRAGLGRLRKIGLLGSHSNSLQSTPWHDPTWELWGHASARGFYARTPEVYFDLHDKVCWTRKGKITGKYPQWLASQTTPIYMQDKHPEVPASMRFPKERAFAEMQYPHPKNHVAFMIALALTQGVTHLGLWGVNYGHETEYGTQRGSCEYWLGIAVGRGVQLVLPPTCTLLQDPPEWYGYESHDETATLVASYRPTHLTVDAPAGPTIVYPGATSMPLMTPPDDVLKEMASEEAEGLRPANMPWGPDDSGRTPSEQRRTTPVPRRTRTRAT